MSEIHHLPGRLVSIRDTHLWVETEGGGEPLVLLVGGPANSHACFHPYFSELADEFQIIYYDYRGRGRSDRSQDVHAIRFEHDVEDLEALRIAVGKDTLNLYGFSYGGLVAQAYALRYPANVRRLILANTIHSAEMWMLNHQNINRELQNQYPEVWSEIERLRAEGFTSTHPEMQKLFAIHSRIIRWYNPDNSSRLESEARRPELYPAFVGEDIEFVIGGEVARLPDFRPRLRELSMPVMILAGRFDRALYPKLQMDFKHFCPQARFVMLERSGTWGHVEEPETVLPLVREFLRD
jgi:proline iminopeptidase